MTAAQACLCPPNGGSAACPVHSATARGAFNPYREPAVMMRLLDQLAAEVRRQDEKHGPFQGTRLGRSRLALACLEDEVAEALDGWRADRKLNEWPHAREEVLQVAAVAIRALRDAFNDDENTEGASNLVG